MNDARWWLVCYDVHDPARLRRCAGVLEGSGQRMQHSVFRCWMTPAQMHRLRWELTQVLEPEDEYPHEPEAAENYNESMYLNAFDAERGIYEDSTYWNPSWTLAHGAVMTSNVADILKSANAIGTGALLSPDSFRQQLDPATAKFKPWTETRYYGLGIFVVDGWLVQNPSFAGYAATMAYLPVQKLAIVVSVTEGPKATEEGNLSTVVLKQIAAYLAPDHPMQ